MAKQKPTMVPRRAAVLLAQKAPGKHRGSTKKQAQGNLRKQDTSRSAYCKRISDTSGKMRKLRELAVFRMAFKRSGVRLPLAPPINYMILHDFL